MLTQFSLGEMYFREISLEKSRMGHFELLAIHFLPLPSLSDTWLDVKSGPVTPPTADEAGVALLFSVHNSFSQIVKQ